MGKKEKSEIEYSDMERNENGDLKPENRMPDQTEEQQGVPQNQGVPQKQMPAGQPGPGYYGYQNLYPNYGGQRDRSFSGNQGYHGNYGYSGYWGDQAFPGNQNIPGNPKKGSPWKKALVAAGICAVVLLCAGSMFYAVKLLTGTPSAESEPVSSQQASAQPEELQIAPVDLDIPGEKDDAKPFQGAFTDVSELVERIMPTVVSVNAVYTYDSRYWGEEKYDGGGSGFIIGENETELLIATNAHVVADSEDLQVSFVDETVADARVKGHDNDLDVAVLAVHLEDISDKTKESIAVAKLGDSTTLKAGQAVLSIGNALLLGQSVTTGIVSAVNMPIGGGYDEAGNQYGSDDRVMIQTTAFMNPGCSGGVLVNASGEVIGINTMTINSMDVEGMCYAIPITDAIPVLDKLKTREIREKLRKDERGYLGITCSNVEGKQAEEYNIPKGVYIRDVEKGGAAEKAGLQKGDIIVALDEISVKSMEELTEMLQYYSVNEIVEIEILRYNKGEYQSEIFSVKLGRR